MRSISSDGIEFPPDRADRMPAAFMVIQLGGHVTWPPASPTGKVWA
jgi:hypothetical protein